MRGRRKERRKDNYKQFYKQLPLGDNKVTLTLTLKEERAVDERIKGVKKRR